VCPPENLQDVVSYFTHKTDSILARYGPGPRVHYHTGLVREAPPSSATTSELRRVLVDGQVRMLERAADAWDAPRRLTGEILDVGCGLGGGSIFWAEEFGAKVTALTCVPSHADFVTKFAEKAGVGRQVTIQVCDAAEFPGRECFDAVIAVDSSGYLPRRRWLGRMASLLRPGGSVHIVDCFLEDARYAELFNSHWHTRIGTTEEYKEAAHESGLEEEAVVDVTEETVHFWTTTLALINAEALNPDAVAASAKAHSLVRDGLANGGLRYSILSFANRAKRRPRAQPALYPAAMDTAERELFTSSEHDPSR
jgi:tocopherol O-methyltransferase